MKKKDLIKMLLAAACMGIGLYFLSLAIYNSGGF